METRVTSAARILLGLVFFVFGLNGIGHFFPLPSMEGRAAEFIAGLAASGYFFPLLFCTYTILGAALLARRFVPLALTALAPVVVHIVAVHLFLAPSPSGLAIALFVLWLEVFVAWSYRAAFRPMLRARHEFTPVSHPAHRAQAAGRAS